MRLNGIGKRVLLLICVELTRLYVLLIKVLLSDPRFHVQLLIEYIVVNGIIMLLRLVRI